MSTPIHVSDDSFEKDVIQSDLTTVVDFWAEWCAPCKLIAPILDEIAAEYQDRLQIAKLDVDSNSATAAQYGIMSIPTLLIFKDGQPVERLVGNMPKAQLLDKIKPHI
ncbi:MAG: thioredoxin [Anaerolineaceae bacterium 4572_32.1]|nr:MAG: thioredoxin [Anaerolineaceae bacterium 4572_32.1]